MVRTNSARLLVPSPRRPRGRQALALCAVLAFSQPDANAFAAAQADSTNFSLDTSSALVGVGSSDSADFNLDTTGPAPAVGAVAYGESQIFQLDTTGPLPALGLAVYADSSDFMLDTTGPAAAAGGIAYADSGVFLLDTTASLSTYSFVVVVNGPGAVIKNPDLPFYAFDSTVILTAIPANPQIQFLGWSGGASGTQNPLTNVLTGNTVITASFQPSLIVSNNLDSGPGSLRDTIASAGPGDRITFNVTGVILLTSGELALGQNLNIAGPGAKNLTISGSHSNRVFNIGTDFNIGSPAVSISGLTIADGADGIPYQQDGRGGGIRNDGTTVISNCVIRDCVAGGSSSSGGSYIHGGGIFNNGYLTLIGDTICSNSAGSLFATNGLGEIATGGGIATFRRLTAINCTIVGNTAAGGLSEAGFGGAIYQLTAALDTSLGLSLSHCTVFGNSASSLPSGSAQAGNSQGGGLHDNEGYVVLRNNVLAGNTTTAGTGNPPGAGGYPDIYIYPVSLDPVNVLTNYGFNLFGALDTGGGAIVPAGSDLKGTVASPLDPKLGPLQENGGPTPTMALLSGSPAIDAGNSAGITIDQRGRPRQVVVTAITNGGDGSDIGAFELAALPLQPPKLTVQITGPNSLTVSWPSPSTGFNLQVTTDLSIGNWVTPSETVQDNGTIKYIVVNPPVGNRFYRLK